MKTDRNHVAWKLLGAIVNTHVNALQSEGMFDEEALESLLGTIASVAGADPPDGDLLTLIAVFDDRIDAQCPPRVTGVARLGRGSAEVVATTARMLIRHQALNLANDTADLITALIEFGGAHVVTMLPAYIGSQPAHPTTLAHLLGGAICPIGRGLDRLSNSLEVVNQSPMGAGALASFRFSPDRLSTALALGFANPIPNTFDAVSSVDYFDLLAFAVEMVVSPVEKLLRELQAWVRSNPETIVFAENQVTRISDLPQLRYPQRIDQLLESAANARSGLGAVRAWTRDAWYGPQLRLDHPLERLLESFDEAGRLMRETSELFNDGFEVNRAVFGNRAGKAFVTSSDLVDFLILEEQIAPGDAQIIANRVLGIIKERGLEIADITREIVDAAGLLVIGREIGVEFETLSKYLAPRRFLENRTAEGSPAPNTTRAWLGAEKTALDERRSRFEMMRQKWDAAVMSSEPHSENVV